VGGQKINPTMAIEAKVPIVVIKADRNLKAKEINFVKIVRRIIIL
jgi:hypothetical protein